MKIIILLILFIDIFSCGAHNIFYDDIGYEKRQYKRDGTLSHSNVQDSVLNSLNQSSFSKYISNTSGNFFEFLQDSYKLPQGLNAPLPEYDFIVIGAGSGGCAVASRLSENRNITVLVLEAGEPETFITSVPVAAPIFQSTDYSWPYYMEPQPGVCKGMINKRCYWPRGRAVGGTSVINYMIYTRGRPQDWDRIAADGNYGWSYNEVIKYYKKLENSNLKGFERAPHRGREGPVPITLGPVRTKLVDAFLEAGRILGNPTLDYNAPEQLGFGVVQSNIDKGRRQSAAKTYLHPYKNRKNLHILSESRVTKILVDPGLKTAQAVEFVNNRVKYTIKARKEVILSAGPIASPQILMLSGIGPKEHLSSIGISTIKNLPVGQTLYDHICFPGLIFTLNNSQRVSLNVFNIDLKTFIDWLRNGDSDLSTSTVEGIGYIKTSKSDDKELVPDIELISLAGSFVTDGGVLGIRQGIRLNEKMYDHAFGAINAGDTWSALPMLLHPKSVGSLKLKNNNPFSHPLMYGNYLTERHDVETLIAAIRYIQELVKTNAFQKYGAKLYRSHIAGCEKYIFDSDDYWECAIRHYTMTLHHQIATCRMGPANDPLAVVDPELKVYGVKKLRVVDSSVIPRTIAAHTNGPAMMIGEKAADMIKTTWGIK